MKKYSCIFAYSTLFLLVLLSACNRYYTSDEFDAKTKNHKTIAVLPVEMKMTGRIPKEITPEQVAQIESGESRAFQSSFASQILTQGNRGKKHYLRVDIQSVEKTNKILLQNDIDITDSWREDPQDLAKMLGVDAVVRAKVVKERYLTDLESIGVQVLGTVLNGILRGNGPWFGFSGRTASIDVNVSLVGQDSGNVLFSTHQEMDVDWSLPANEAIDRVCRRVARKMPYRTKVRD